MSGLFNDIASRFSADAVPQIRPRPQARFEGETGGELEEQGAVAIAPAVSTPRAAPAGVKRRPPLERPADKAETPRPQHQEQTGDAPLVGSAGETPAERSTAPAGDTPLPEPSELVENPEPLRAENPATDLPQVPMPDDTTPTSDEDIMLPADVTHAPTEATEVAAAEHPVVLPETERAGLHAAPPDAPATDQPTEAPQEAYVVRIGRIEVRQPAKPQPPAPPAPVRREPPPRRATATVAPRTNASRLTDYLGWKK